MWNIAVTSQCSTEGPRVLHCAYIGFWCVQCMECTSCSSKISTFPVLRKWRFFSRFAW